jgi:hypothetical protein
MDFNDPMRQKMLEKLDAYQRWQLMGGKKQGVPLASDFSGGDKKEEAILRALIERILSKPYADVPPQPKKKGWPWTWFGGEDDSVTAADKIEGQ